MASTSRAASKAIAKRVKPGRELHGIHPCAEILMRSWLWSTLKPAGTDTCPAREASCESQETLAGGIDIRSLESSILLSIALDSAQPDELQESLQSSQFICLFDRAGFVAVGEVASPVTSARDAKSPLT